MTEDEFRLTIAQQAERIAELEGRAHGQQDVALMRVETQRALAKAARLEQQLEVVRGQVRTLSAEVSAAYARVENLEKLRVRDDRRKKVCNEWAVRALRAENAVLVICNVKERWGKKK